MIKIIPTTIFTNISFLLTYLQNYKRCFTHVVNKNLIYCSIGVENTNLKIKRTHGQPPLTTNVKISYAKNQHGMPMNLQTHFRNFYYLRILNTISTIMRGASNMYHVLLALLVNFRFLCRSDGVRIS